MVKDTTLYDRLGVSPHASEQEINNAGRKMSKKWHPDKNMENRQEAETRFKEIREAIDILSDEKKRSQYDECGMEILDPSRGDDDAFSFHDFMGGMGGFPFPGRGMRGFPFPGGIPGMGGIGGIGGMPGPQEEKAENIVHFLTVTLDQIVKEQKVSFTYDQRLLCKKCNGEGTKGGDPSLNKTCEKCQGKGMCVQIRHMGPMIQQSMMPCTDCGGKGKRISEKCEECNGGMYFTQKTKDTIKLQNGLENNMKLKVDGKGNQTKNGYTDLIIIIQEEPNEVFRRDGSHLHVDIELNLYEALFGFTKLVHHINGKTIKIRCTSKTEYNTVRKLVGEGLKDLRTNKEGNLYIHFAFYLPDIQHVSEIEELREEINMDRLKNENIEEQPLLFVSKNELLNTSDSDEEKNHNGNRNRNNGNEQPRVQECRTM